MLNIAILMGRLTSNPEIKITQNDVKYTRFTVAINKGKDEVKADFIDCVAWNNTAEFICKYFKKGQLIAIDGEIKTSVYEKDGENRKQVNVRVKSASFAGFNKTNYSESGTVVTDFESFGADDDLPF